MSKKSRASTEVPPSPSVKRRRSSPLQFWCDNFDRSKTLRNTLMTWRASEHRIRHARGPLGKGSAIPADLKRIIDSIEKAMEPLPPGSELYFASYDPHWKYHPEWWLPCSRTLRGADKAKRHHYPAPEPGAKVTVFKLLIEEDVPGVWAGALGTEHDDEEEIILGGDLNLTKVDATTYRVSLEDPEETNERHQPHGHQEGKKKQVAKKEEEDDEEEGEEEEEVQSGDDEKQEEKPAASSSYCIVS